MCTHFISAQHERLCFILIYALSWQQLVAGSAVNVSQQESLICLKPKMDAQKLLLKTVTQLAWLWTLKWNAELWWSMAFCACVCVIIVIFSYCYIHVSEFSRIQYLTHCWKPSAGLSVIPKSISPTEFSSACTATGLRACVHIPIISAWHLLSASMESAWCTEIKET